MVRRESLCGAAHAIDVLGLTSVQTGDLFGRFCSIVSWFYLDFLACDGQSDIHRACRSLGDTLFLVQDAVAQGLARVVLE